MPDLTSPLFNGDTLDVVMVDNTLLDLVVPDPTTGRSFRPTMTIVTDRVGSMIVSTMVTPADPADDRAWRGPAQANDDGSRTPAR